MTMQLRTRVAQLNQFRSSFHCALSLQSLPTLLDSEGLVWSFMMLPIFLRTVALCSAADRDQKQIRSLLAKPRKQFGKVTCQTLLMTCSNIIFQELVMAYDGVRLISGTRPHGSFDAHPLTQRRPFFGTQH